MRFALNVISWDVRCHFTKQEKKKKKKATKIQNPQPILMLMSMVENGSHDRHAHFYHFQVQEKNNNILFAQLINLNRIMWLAWMAIRLNELICLCSNDHITIYWMDINSVVE